jgi:hypothetical protein
VHAGEWHDVTNLQLWSNAYTAPQIRIALPNQTVKNPSACPGDANTIDSYMVNETLPVDVKQRIYSTLLAAKMAKISIRLRIEGCYGGRPAITNVVLL